MGDGYEVRVEEAPDEADVAAVRAGLVAYNLGHAADGSYTPITLLVRGPGGEVAGGLLGGTYWGWLGVEILWLAEGARGRGLGGELLARAEAIALTRGCHSAHVDTMSFQAPEFYVRRGYEVYGVLEDMPPGHRRVFLRKRLVGGVENDPQMTQMM